MQMSSIKLMESSEEKELFRAAEVGDIMTLKELLQKGVSPNVANEVC